MPEPRTIRIGGADLDCPALFASYRIGDYPRAGLRCHPWEMTCTQGLLLNAYDLIANKRTRMFAEDIRHRPGKLHEQVGFNGPLILDSGAFNFMKNEEITITPIEVLNIGIEMAVDVSVVLDHPFPPKSTPEEISQRWANTLGNSKIMFEALASHNGDIPINLRLMPVLHGHDTETLKRSLDDITAIIGREPEILGIGSLAPLAQNGSKRTVIDVISTTRKMLPNAHIHCFSLGSALLMLFAFYCGADTVDSQTWIMSAAFKQVQLPGFHLTRLSPQESERNSAKYERNRHAFAVRVMELIHEENFTPKNWDTGAAWPITDNKDALAYVDYLQDRDGTNHIHRRACHNLHVFNFETSRIRDAIRSGNLEDFIHSRVRSTVYRRAFEYAVEKKASLKRG